MKGILKVSLVTVLAGVALSIILWSLGFTISFSPGVRAQGLSPIYLPLVMKKYSGETQPPSCPNPDVQITAPGPGAHLEGAVEIWGTADIDQFQYYKVEYGAGETPPGWVVIDDLKYEPVSEGVLVVWNTTGLTRGTYILRLTVVDITGYYPPPCQVQLYVE